MPIEYSKEDILEILKSFGFNNFKIRFNIISVLVDYNKRQETLDYLISQMSYAVYCQDAPGSSIGALKIGKFRIQVKPINMQGRKSSGVSNEHLLCDEIQKYLNLYSKINIQFVSDKKILYYENINNIMHVGKSSLKDYKADVLLIDSDKAYPISLKKDNSVFWAKAENHYGQKAILILSEAIKKNLLKLEYKGFYYRLSSELGFEPSGDDKQILVFGKDNVKIIKKTFNVKDFSFDKSNNLLTVNANTIFEDLQDIDEYHDVFYILRNDKSRNSKKLGIRGITLECVMKTRILGNKNLVVVDNPFNHDIEVSNQSSL